MELSSTSKVIFDTSDSYKKPNYSAPAREWKNFMSSNPSQIFQEKMERFSKRDSALEEKEFMRDIKKVNALGVKQMSWKERKRIENETMVSLGAKPPKKYRMPIAIARGIKKNQEKREKTSPMNEENILGRPTKQAKKTNKPRRKEPRGIMASEGIFRNGVLHVKSWKHEATEDHIQKMNIGKKRKHPKKHNGRRK